MTTAEEGTRDRRRSRPAGLLTLGIGVALGVVLETGPTLAAPGDRRACSSTAAAQFDACGLQARSDFFIAKAKCANVSEQEVEGCTTEAKTARQEAKQLCRDQHDGRRELCKALGEARYHPSFAPTDFDTDFSTLKNPYFPL